LVDTFGNFDQTLVTWCDDIKILVPPDDDFALTASWHRPRPQVDACFCWSWKLPVGRQSKVTMTAPPTRKPRRKQGHDPLL